MLSAEKYCRREAVSAIAEAILTSETVRENHEETEAAALREALAASS